MKPLFVAGCPRSGTTGFINYLNQHPQIMICRERYKYVPPKEIGPDLFTFERILDYRENETNTRREYHVQLLAKKDPEELKWVGDKYPLYVKWFKTLIKNVPGARFIVLYRSVEEVAESFEARAQDPRDAWPSENGFEAGVRLWNSTLRYVREFLESFPEAEVLVVDYHDFFYQNETCVPLIARFLELEFKESVREDWEKMSQNFENSRRQKKPISAERESFVHKNKDYAAEKWILNYIDEQRRELNRESQTKEFVRRANLKQIESLQSQLARERLRSERFKEKNRQLTKRVRDLRQQVSDIRNSKIWRVLQKFARVRARALAETARLKSQFDAFLASSRKERN